jgi:hypothetical protein
MTLYLRPLVIAGCYTACVFEVAQGICEAGMNPFEVRAIAFGTALSPSVEPVPVSMASPLQSHIAGETK